MTGPLILLRRATFGYDDQPVVRDVDLEINDGDVVALIGPNGSGKSTLVKGLLGLDEHLGGTVELFGTAQAAFRDHARIGYVPQRHSLSAAVRATAIEVVRVGRVVRRPWWRPASANDDRIARQALALVGLEEAADTEVANLSGGQQRRVLIARALASEPQLLVMDEPTAGVDEASQEELADVLARLAEQGMAMVIVTHELEALELIVNRIVCLRDGRVDFDGTPQGYAAHEFEHESGHGHHHVEVTAPARHGLGPLDAGLEGSAR